MKKRITIDGGAVVYILEHPVYKRGAISYGQRSMPFLIIARKGWIEAFDKRATEREE